MIIEPIIMLCAAHAVTCGNTTEYVNHNYQTLQVFSNGNVGINAGLIMVDKARPQLVNACALGPAAEVDTDSATGSNIKACAEAATTTNTQTWAGQKESRARGAKWVEPTAKLTVGGTIKANKLIIWGNDACYTASGVSGSTISDCPFAERYISAVITGTVNKGNVTLNWSTAANAPNATCSASGSGSAQGWHGELGPNGQKTMTFVTADPLTFTINCNVPGSTASDSNSITIAPQPDPYVAIAFSRQEKLLNNILHYTISWNATYVGLEPGKCVSDWSKSEATVGVSPLLPADARTSWSMQCFDATQTHSRYDSFIHDGGHPEP